MTNFLNMNIPLEKTKNFKDAKDLLFTIGRTLKIEDKPVDFDELYNELNK
jgi:hypothetical protein